MFGKRMRKENVSTPADVCSQRQRDNLFSEAEHWFLQQARDAADRELRLKLIHHFCQINLGIPSAHNELELLLMADFLLRSAVEGAVVECGSYKGASAAKLSHVSKATGRSLFVCDSFQGLPEPELQDKLHHSSVTGEELPYSKGQYAASLDEVKGHIAEFGVPEVCTYVEGFFSDTLPHLKIDRLSFVFMDVDYISSARDCLQYLWPMLSAGGRLYTHEVDIDEFIYGITDQFWWHEVLGQCPPLLIGAGYGFGESARHLGFFEKRISSKEGDK
jgi:predicted O-methyltransferase YrrM